MKKKQIDWNKFTSLTLYQALLMIDGKRGSGISKTTKLKIELEFKASIVQTKTILAALESILRAIDIDNKNNILPAKFTIYETEVITQLEENDNWDRSLIGIRDINGNKIL